MLFRSWDSTLPSDLMTLVGCVPDTKRNNYGIQTVSQNNIVYVTFAISFCELLE